MTLGHWAINLRRFWRNIVLHGQWSRFQITAKTAEDEGTACFRNLGNWWGNGRRSTISGKKTNPHTRTSSIFSSFVTRRLWMILSTNTCIVSVFRASLTGQDTLTSRLRQQAFVSARSKKWERNKTKSKLVAFLIVGQTYLIFMAYLFSGTTV